MARGKQTDSVAPGVPRLLRPTAVHGRPHTTLRGTHAAPPPKGQVVPRLVSTGGLDGTARLSCAGGQNHPASSHCVFLSPPGISIIPVDLAICFYRTVTREREVRPRTGRGGSREGGWTHWAVQTQPSAASLCSPEFDPTAYRTSHSRWAGDTLSPIQTFFLIQLLQELRQRGRCN